MKNNQIRQQKIRAAGKTDTEKLIAIVNHLKKKYSKIAVKREPFFMFNKRTDKLFSMEMSCTEEQVRKYKIHPPDIVIFTADDTFVIELDGSWHDDHQIQDEIRNHLYDFNNIKYFVINETELCLRLTHQILHIDNIIIEVDRKIKERGWLH